MSAKLIDESQIGIDYSFLLSLMPNVWATWIRTCKRELMKTAIRVALTTKNIVFRGPSFTWLKIPDNLFWNCCQLAGHSQW